MHRGRTRSSWIVPSAFAMAAALSAPDAEACGGLFCSAANPVNQAAERIVFAHDEAAQRVTAVIEILYEGPAERFAWILPVPGTPEVSVSTNALLNRLQQATNPNYQLQRTWNNEGCDEQWNTFPPAAIPTPQDDCATNPLTLSCGAAGSPAVSVLASGSAGPYDFQVIGVAASAEDPASEAIDWLVENGYDTGATGPDLLRPYLASGLNLLAVRLDKQAAVGSIRPIKIAYDSGEPMIPIRPTAVAANDDMGILVWVLGASRAVPFNYKTLELNDALIDWFNPQQSYNDVVIAAANETGDGQGFVTELARPTVDPVQGNITDQFFQEQNAIQSFRSSADGLSNADLIVDVVQRFSVVNSGFSGPFAAAAPQGRVTLDGVADVLARNLTLPPDTAVGAVIESPSCYFEELQGSDAFYCEGRPAPPQRIDLTGFDRRAFLTDVEALVIAPIEQTVQLFADQPYMTRFYTTLSADEMSVDPVFRLNPDLTDVSNQHTLAIEYEGCSGDTSGAWQADVGGRSVRGTGNTWPLTLANLDPDMPLNSRILQLSATGSGEVYEDNTDVIGALLADRFGDPSGPGTPDPTAPPGSSMGTISGSGGCALTPASAAGKFPSGWLQAASALLGLAALLRRRARGAAPGR